MLFRLKVQNSRDMFLQAHHRISLSAIQKKKRKEVNSCFYFFKTWQKCAVFMQLTYLERRKHHAMAKGGRRIPTWRSCLVIH